LMPQGTVWLLAVVVGKVFRQPNQYFGRKH
jgi:hypothetical protein